MDISRLVDSNLKFVEIHGLGCIKWNVAKLSFNFKLEAEIALTLISLTPHHATPPARKFF